MNSMPAGMPTFACPSCGCAPPADEVLALIRASSLPLEVTPPATLSEHAAIQPEGDDLPRTDCEPLGEGSWRCAVWAAPRIQGRVVELQRDTLGCFNTMELVGRWPMPAEIAEALTRHHTDFHKRP